MKKKIVDLTVREVRKICSQNVYCKSCPLYIDDDCIIETLLIKHNTEIEVDENENRNNS